MKAANTDLKTNMNPYIFTLFQDGQTLFHCFIFLIRNLYLPNVISTLKFKFRDQRMTNKSIVRFCTFYDFRALKVGRTENLIV